MTTIDSSDDEVEQTETVTFTTELDIREDERIPVDYYVLTFTTNSESGTSVDVLFTPDGELLGTNPEDGTAGDGRIRTQQLKKKLTITPVNTPDRYGYGSLAGENERTGTENEYGYGYGYGGGDTTATYEITVDAQAFKQGAYTAQFSVVTDGSTRQFASNEVSFDVVVNDKRGRSSGGVNEVGDDADEGDDSDDTPGRATDARLPAFLRTLFGNQLSALSNFFAGGH